MNDAFELIEALGKRIKLFFLGMLQDFRKNPVKTLFIPFFIIEDFSIEHTAYNLQYVTLCVTDSMYY